MGVVRNDWFDRGLLSVRYMLIPPSLGRPQLPLKCMLVFVVLAMGAHPMGNVTYL